MKTDGKALYVGGGFATVGYDFFSYRFAILHFASASVTPQKEILALQNYPNPFASQTIITYSLEKDASVAIELYTVLGEKLKTLINATESAGEHTITLDAGSLPSGMYLCKFRSGATTQMKSIQVLK
jgi:hypothetical protein